MAQLTISVVIPTRNRPTSLSRVLQALSVQQRLPDEVIVVDASDHPLDVEHLRRQYPQLRLTMLRMAPSVCVQRNTAVRRAVGTHILLCDDDIEPPPEYLRHLTAFLKQHPTTGALTGVVVEPGDGEPVAGFPTPSFRHLLLAWVFQRTVWGDVEGTRATWLTGLPLRLLKRWYRRRGNTWSLAGWPLVTQVRAPAVRTAVYALGAALVRRDWLLASPYDERLDAHGIGDNYGVALQFPHPGGVVVLTDLRVQHHRDAANRLDATCSYYRRILALHYFLKTLPQFSGVNVGFLAWSLLGNALAFALRRNQSGLAATLRALWVVATGRNPLLLPPWASRPC